MSKTSEIRFDMPTEELSVLDGYVNAKGKCRTEVIRKILSDWSEAKRHEATLICRVAGINPVESEDDRK